jgi:hypothetical protein
MDDIKYIGCCGAYCKNCRSLIRKCCKGCKIGFKDGERNINLSKCNVKICCFRVNNFESCAECKKIESCGIMKKWYKKNDGKYGKYKELLEYIKNNGYDKFIEIANNWKNEFGEINEKNKAMVNNDT